MYSDPIKFVRFFYVMLLNLLFSNREWIEWFLVTSYYRFNTIAYLQQIRWLEVCGDLEFQFFDRDIQFVLQTQAGKGWQEIGSLGL